MKLPLKVRKLLCRLQGMRWLTDDDVVFQERVDNCGGACLRMALRVFDQPEQLVEQVARSPLRRLSLLEIVGVLRNVGLDAVGFEFCSLDQLRWILVQHEKVVPLIVLRRAGILHSQGSLGHLVIVVGLTETNAELKDPAIGHVCLSKEALSKRWTGKALLACSMDFGEKLRCSALIAGLERQDRLVE